MPGELEHPQIAYSEYEIRFKAAEYCEKWIGIFYLYGGDDPSGFDCNGIMHEVLQAYGVEKRGYDCTAHQLYLNHKSKEIKKRPYPGCLVFWFKKGTEHVQHVEMVTEVIQDLIFTTGASGGGKRTTTEKAAIQHNAYIKKNPINYRGKNYVVCDPFLKGEGE